MVNGGDHSNTEFMIFETLALTGWRRRVFQSGSSSATQLHTATHSSTQCSGCVYGAPTLHTTSFFILVGVGAPI